MRLIHATKEMIVPGLLPHSLSRPISIAAALALLAPAFAAPPAAHDDHDHAPPSRPSSAGGSRPSPSPQKAAQSLAQKRIMSGDGGPFRPDQPVTRGELAIVLDRMVRYLENQGPQKVSQSKSPPLVLPRVKTSLAAIPRTHRAYTALSRLALGGYLLPSSGDLFLPTRQNIDRPVTARELATALAGISSRILEKRTALERPEILEDQRETVTSPGQRRGGATPPQ
jgi:hypothetical protein